MFETLIFALIFILNSDDIKLIHKQKGGIFVNRYLKMLSVVVICAFVFILGNKSLALELNDEESRF